MKGRLAVLVAGLLAASCARHQPAPRSPATVVEAAPPAPEPPQACYSRDDAPTRQAGDVAMTDDPKKSVFVLDREMLPELARRLDHPSGAQKHSSLDKAILEMVARHYVSAVNDCYKALLAKKSDEPRGEAGTVATRFAVGADGQVTHAHVSESTLQDPETEDCIGRSLCGWRFPALAGGHSLVVDYPFLLSPPP